MHERFLSKALIALPSLILMLGGTADAASLTSASRSVEAEANWKFKWDFGVPPHSASATVGPSTAFGVFDEVADANANNGSPDALFTRVLTTQTSNIAPTFVAADMSLTASSAGLDVNDVGGYSGRNVFHVEFSVATPTDAIFDAAIAKDQVQSHSFANIKFFRVGGGFDISGASPYFGPLALHFNGTLQPGDYIIDAELKIDYDPYPYLSELTDSNSVGVYLTIVPTPGTICVALCAGALGLRRRRE